MVFHKSFSFFPGINLVYLCKVMIRLRKNNEVIETLFEIKIVILHLDQSQNGIMGTYLGIFGTESALENTRQILVKTPG